MVKLETEDRIFLCLEKKVLHAKRRETVGNGEKARPLAFDQVAVRDCDEVEVMPRWLGDRSVRDRSAAWESVGAPLDSGRSPLLHSRRGAQPAPEKTAAHFHALLMLWRRRLLISVRL